MSAAPGGGVESVEHEGRLLAMIIRRDFRQDGIAFFTPADFSASGAGLSS